MTTIELGPGFNKTQGVVKVSGGNVNICSAAFEPDPLIVAVRESEDAAKFAHGERMNSFPPWLPQETKSRRLTPDDQLRPLIDIAKQEFSDVIEPNLFRPTRVTININRDVEAHRDNAIGWAMIFGFNVRREKTLMLLDSVIDIHLTSKTIAMFNPVELHQTKLHSIEAGLRTVQINFSLILWSREGDRL